MSLNDVRTQKREAKTRINELNNKMSCIRQEIAELNDYLKELEEAELILFEREVGVTKLSPKDPTTRVKRKPTNTKDEISEKLQTLSPEEKRQLFSLIMENGDSE